VPFTLEEVSMRSLTKLAAALAVTLPLIGAGVGTAQARDSVGLTVTIGSHGYGHGNGYGYGYGPRYHRAIPPGIIRDSLARQYYEVSRPDRRGDVYVARAEDRRGRDLRITVNAYTGEIIDVDYARRDRDRHDGRWNRQNSWR
jgi:hypothetical protein